MGVDVVALGQLAAQPGAQHPLDQLRPPTAEPVEALGGERLEPPHGGTGKASRQDAAQQVGDGVLLGQRGDVGRRALQHRHVRGLLGHGGHERDGGGAAADDDHTLARVVEIVGPLLRMDDRAGEALGAFERGRVTVVVAVVAAAREQEAGGQLDALARVSTFSGDVPAGVGRRPVGGHDAMPEADVVVDALGGGGVLDVLQDRRAVDDRLLAAPRAERIAEGEHVRVRAHAGVAEQIPRAADGLPRLEDGVARPRAFILDVVAGADAGETGADDEDVEMLHGSFDQAAAVTSLSLSVPCSPNSSARQRVTSSVVSRSSGWKSGRS